MHTSSSAGAIRRTATAALVTCTLASLAACGSSAGPGVADTGTADPAATFATVPPSTAPPPAPATPAATTMPLVPSPEADLPTAPPDAGTEAAPRPAVPAGPLPIPTVQLVAAGDFDAPVGAAVRPIDPRLFIVEQGGRVVAVDDESATPVLDARDLTAAGGERGLLGLAFHPDQDLAYVNYTDLDGNTVVAEYAIDPVTAVFDPASFRTVLTVEQPFGNHNGGALAFGPDGYLYIGLGDGGSADDPQRNALDLSTRLGKLLRIDPIESGAEPFVVPPDNPFVGVDGADPTIWSLGLRNPWRISFDELTGDLWIADVGQNEFEEVDRAPAVDGLDAGRGLSFGWSAFEANARFNPDQGADGHTPPVIEYPHLDDNCSISGGVVARDSPVDDLDGWYVYGDYCSGRIWGYDTTSEAGAPVIVELATLPSLSAIAAGPDGELYAISNAGPVARLANV